MTAAQVAARLRTEGWSAQLDGTRWCCRCGAGRWEATPNLAAMALVTHRKKGCAG